ncbi:unnamed protein product, partial [Laminaria digitata]
MEYFVGLSLRFSPKSVFGRGMELLKREASENSLGLSSSSSSSVIVSHGTNEKNSEIPAAVEQDEKGRTEPQTSARPNGKQTGTNSNQSVPHLGPASLPCFAACFARESAIQTVLRWVQQTGYSSTD